MYEESDIVKGINKLIKSINEGNFKPTEKQKQEISERFEKFWERLETTMNELAISTKEFTDAIMLLQEKEDDLTIARREVEKLNDLKNFGFNAIEKAGIVIFSLRLKEQYRISFYEVFNIIRLMLDQQINPITQQLQSIEKLTRVLLLELNNLTSDEIKILEIINAPISYVLNGKENTLTQYNKYTSLYFKRYLALKYKEIANLESHTGRDVMDINQIDLKYHLEGTNRCDGSNHG